MDLRCPTGKKFGELTDPAVLEVKCSLCRDRLGKGVVVIHRFDAFTGELLGTLTIKEPPEGGMVRNDAQRNGNPVWPQGRSDHAVH